MPFRQVESLRIFQFEIFDGCQLTHAVVTRRGGVSPAPWESLNVGASVGDDAVRVKENIARIFKTLGRDPASKHDVWQVHSNKVQVVDLPRGGAPPIQADIMITNRPEIILFMRFADCVPLFLFDPVAKAIALVHAGRQGLARNAPTAAVQALIKNFDSKPRHILAGIGPSICPDCYSIGEEAVRDFMDTVGEEEGKRYLTSVNNQVHLDLWSCTRAQLESCGVNQIENSGICTATNLSDWYSHRAEKGKTGRFAALLGIV